MKKLILTLAVPTMFACGTSNEQNSETDNYAHLLPKTTTQEPLITAEGDDLSNINTWAAVYGEPPKETTPVKSHYDKLITFEFNVARILKKGINEIQRMYAKGIKVVVDGQHKDAIGESQVAQVEIEIGEETVELDLQLEEYQDGDDKRFRFIGFLNPDQTIVVQEGQEKVEHTVKLKVDGEYENDSFTGNPFFTISFLGKN